MQTMDVGGESLKYGMGAGREDPSEEFPTKEVFCLLQAFRRWWEASHDKI